MWPKLESVRDNVGQDEAGWPIGTRQCRAEVLRSQRAGPAPVELRMGDRGVEDSEGRYRSHWS